MNEYEKEIMRLLKAHEKIRKVELVDNINRAIKKKSVCPYGKNKWVCKVTGSPMGTVCTWFTKSKCRAENKIPLYAMCQIAAALNVSVWNFLEERKPISRKVWSLIDEVSCIGILEEMKRRSGGMTAIFRRRENGENRV